MTAGPATREGSAGPAAGGGSSRGPTEPLLRVRGLKTYFRTGSRWLGGPEWLRAVDGVDLEIRRGEVLGLVGESGSGKTTLGRSILRLEDPSEGTIHFDGIDLGTLDRREFRRVRRRMQFIFQDPYAALNPRMQIGQLLAEPLRYHQVVPGPEVQARVKELLREVGLDPHLRHRYPHQASGGQRQRIAIARALASKPEFVVADEPVSALDVSVQAEILGLLRRLQREEGIAMLFIAHDLAVVERIADRVAVMYRGRIVERGPTSRLLRRPLHPYTQALLAAVPTLAGSGATVRAGLAGEAPSAVGEIEGCPFASRCPEVQERCRREAPALEEKGPGHAASCHFR